MDVVTLGAALRGAKMYTDATIAPLLGGVHYRGSVNYASNLPADPSEGDAYTVKYKGTTGTDPDCAEYVWGLDTDDNTYKWIVFAADTYTKAEVDALLSGKQSTIDSTHKLSSDLVDDSNSTHKFVTALEKRTWNGKQNSIDSSHKLSSNLVDDTNATNKFVTESEKQTWNGKQDALVVGTNLDAVPTQNSTNPITSGGVYAVVGNINTVLEEVL